MLKYQKEGGTGDVEEMFSVALEDEYTCFEASDYPILSNAGLECRPTALSAGLSDNCETFFSLIALGIVCPKLNSSTNSLTDLMTLKDHKTKYALDGYRVFFSAKLARQYEPIVYSGECMSGDPEALYYRILQNDSDKKNEFCIQYFYYWQYQNCMMTSHGYDYEPIFIYLKSGNSNPYLIVNGGLGKPDCHFHKNEVRPRKGKRDNDTQHVTTTLSPYPSYPFGQDGNVRYRACVKTYPLDTGEDLQFEEEEEQEEGNRPLFGIRACSNVFSGAKGDLHGHRFNAPLKKLTDTVLRKWYFHHYEDTNDMPFGHDIADPFTSPYIKFHKPSKEEVERLRKQQR